MDELLERSTLLRARRPISAWVATVGVPATAVFCLEQYVPVTPSWLLLLTPSIVCVAAVYSLAQAVLLSVLIPIIYLIVKVSHDPSATAVAWQVAGWSLFHFAICTALLGGWKSTAKRMAEIAERDTLTGAGNSISFFRTARQAITRCRAAGQPLSIVVMDCDNFKQFNDTRGHLAGDELLKQVALTIQQRLRSGDRLIRWGGDEFVILLPDCPLEYGDATVRELRDVLAAVPASTAGSVTFSWGVVTYDVPPADEEVLLREGDELMYAAKRAGRDRVHSRHVPAMLRAT